MDNGMPPVYSSAQDRSAKAFGIVGLIFTMLGFLMLFGAALWAHKTLSFKTEAQQVEGQVVDLIANYSSDSSTYAPKYQFNVEGRAYTVISRTSSNPPAYNVGDKVQVLFDPADPMAARLDGFMDLWFGPTIVGAIGAVFMAVGLIPLYIYWSRRRDVQYLLRHGRPFMAQFERVEAASANPQGRQQFYVVARWHDTQTNQIQVYRSDALAFDPSDFIAPEQLITVLVHPKKPAVYWVDTSFLPRLGA